MTALSSPQWPLDQLVAALRDLHSIPANEAADRLEKPTWVQVGATLDAGEFWYDDDERWYSWSAEVVEQIDERGAWFLVGWNHAADRIVIDVLGAHSRIPELLHARNIRMVEFWRGWS